MRSSVAIIIVTVLTVMVLVAMSVSFRRSSLVSLNQMISQPLPDIQLTDQAGVPYDLGQLKGKNVVLFFSEGLMCYPACWNQMTAFGTDPRFNNADIVAISVIADSPQAWQKAAARMPDLAKTTVLFDTDAKAAQQLELLSVASSMHGGKFPGHTYIVLDKQGIIRRVLDDVSMSVNNDKIIEEITNLYK